MQPTRSIVALPTLLVALWSCPASSSGVTPIQKVIQMMDEMLAKGKAMKHEEEVEFAKFKQWCDDERSQTQRSIDEATADLEKLAADIAKAESDAEVLAEEVQELNKEIASLDNDAKSATVVRKKEREIYTAQHLDLTESVEAIEKAIMVLKSRSADVPQSLMQVGRSKLVPQQAKDVLTSFLQQAPEPNAYESQSGGVISMLEKLKIKFEDQKLLLEKEEMTAKANYDTLMQQLTDDMKADKSAVSSKTATKASRLEDAAQGKGDVSVTQKAKATDEKTLSDTKAQCESRSQEYESNQVTRGEELEAIAKAIEILSSDKVKGAGERNLPSALLQASRKGTVLASLRNSVQEAPSLRSKAVQYLQAKASKLGSRYLQVVAAHTEGDAFGKVKKMIKDLIVKLMEEANSEADQNGYCTAELATNKETREIKTSEVDELSSQVEMETAKGEQLATDIANLADGISELKGKQSEATTMRSTEKKTNAKAIAEAKEAQAAVEQAIKVLKDFYEAGEGGAAALLQSKAPYKGMQAESGGILGMLEVVLSDFARLETETAEAEEQAQNAYDKFMDESNQDAAVKETEKKHKENNKDRSAEKLRGLKKELEMTQTELDSALDYYGKLKKQCLDSGTSYEERKKMREEEIVSLQEALKILDGEALA